MMLDGLTAGEVAGVVAGVTAKLALIGAAIFYIGRGIMRSRG